MTALSNKYYSGHKKVTHDKQKTPERNERKRNVERFQVQLQEDGAKTELDGDKWSAACSIWSNKSQ